MPDTITPAEIKRCLCGGEAEYVPGSPYGQTNTYMRCRNCARHGPGYRVVPAGQNSRIPNITKGDAVAAWNATS